ncbi:hypothetical protein OAA06_02120 [bacterium]|nr:hypothetical protein [bacterium]
MKTPFSIKYTKRLKQNFNGIQNIEILEKFKTRFDLTWCDESIIVSDSKLNVRNEFIRIKPNLNFNLWAGVGLAELEIHNIQNRERQLTYRIEFTRLSLSIIISAILFSAIILFNIDGVMYRNQVLGILGIMFLSIGILTHSILILRHWSLFIMIINEIKTGYNK